MALCLGRPTAGVQPVPPVLAPPLPDINRNTDGRVLFFDKNYTDMLEEAAAAAVEPKRVEEPKESPQDTSQESSQDTPQESSQDTSHESSQDAPQEESQEAVETIMYPSVRLNFREGPGLEAGIIKVLNPNEAVVVLDNEDGWYHVRQDPEEVGEGGEGEEGGEEPIYGYVKEEYLSAEMLTGGQLNRWGIELTPEEIDLLAKILWVEARGEPFEGQAAVVEVIFNRMISTSKDLPENDLVGILSSDRCGVQFASWALRDTADPGEDLYQVIYQVLDGSVTVLPSTDYVFFSTRGMGKNIIQIGHHRFGM